MIRLIFVLFFITILHFQALTQGLIINEFCSQNAYLTDEDNETPDWFELYNNGTTPLNLFNYSISDDSSNLVKWQFPEIILPANKTLLVFASSKDRKETIYYKNLINWGDTFSYTVGAATVPINWKSIEFDDSQWPKGASGFGYGDNDDKTIFPTGYLSVFIRKIFEIADITKISNLLLHVDYDDGFVAYLNGVEVARANLGTVNSDVSYNQTADINHEAVMITGGSPELFMIENINDILVQGTNVLSIQIHNLSTTSSDLSLIPFLSAGYKTAVDGNPMPDIIKINDQLLHTNFNIASEGEKLYLTDNSGNPIDITDSVALPLGVSYGRLTNDINQWAYFSEPTPGELNTTQAYDSLGMNTVAFSPAGGVYLRNQLVSLSTTTGTNIYYTLDGTTPSTSSHLYTAPISVLTSTVIRAISENNNILSTVTSTESYIITVQETKLPVVSLSTNPFNFFDYNYGIYEMGPNPGTDYPYFNANFWKDWERPINIEYFDNNGVKQFNASGGVKIFGAWSRANAQKSLALFARNEYGTKSFKYPFFTERSNDSYKALVLRNSGNDWGSTAMRDAMMTGLVRDIDIDRQAYQPVTVYINGSYWGILNLREKVNEDFLADNNTGVDADKIDLLEQNGVAVEGTADHYTQMLNYISGHILSNETYYDSVCKMMDVVNFMEYQIAQIYFDNRDWPGNNIKFWRPQTNTGKWRWILYDTDFGFGIWGNQNYTFNTLEFATATNGPDWPNPPWSTYLLRSLLKNESFKQEFINRFADRLNKEFLPTTVNHFIDSLSFNIEDEMTNHIIRWNHISDWNYNLTVLSNFATNRPDYMRNYINSQFGLGGDAKLTVEVSDVKAGVVQVNSLLLTTYPWTGKYFKKNTLPVVAIANPGYEFSHWEGYDSNEALINIDFPYSTMIIKAVFKPATNDYNSIVVNEINYSSASDFDCGDWLEIYNTTDANLDLSGWILKDSDASHEFQFPSGTIISKKDYLVLSKELTKFTTLYPSVGNVLGGLDFGFGSTSDRLKIYDRNTLLIDSVTYLNENPWPEINENQTIALISPFKDNAIGSHWEASVGKGTPGTHNEYFSTIPKPTSTANATIASCFPNPTQFNATVRWTNSNAGDVQIGIYNINSDLIEQINSQYYPSGTFEYILNANNYPSGIYFVRLTFDGGETKTLKLVKL